jgi:hypothetical protein
MDYVNDSSRVWHVAKTGNDANSGHAGQYPVNLASDALLTIQAAVNNASSGDTVIVWPGDYAENVTMAIKGNPKVLNLVGINREMTRIIPASGVPLYAIDGSTVKNISAISTGAGIIGIGRGSGYNSPAGLTLENCYAYSEMDGLNISSNLVLRLKDCVFECTYDGVNLRNCRNVYAENCTFKSPGSATTTSHAAQSPGIGIYKNCQFITHTTISASYEVGCVSLIQNTEYPDQVIFDGCTFYTIAPAGRTGQVYGVKTAYSGAMAILNNCLFSTTGQGASGGAKDLINQAGTIIVSGCRYDAAKTSGVITQAVSADNYVELLVKAAKTTTNKASQDKLSGAIRYYDNDGQTVILTHTPSEDGLSLTRAVS